MEDWREQCTSLEHYRVMFDSEAFRSVRRFVFRNPACLPAELVELKSLRPDLQVLVVRSSQQYVCLHHWSSGWVAMESGLACR